MLENNEICLDLFFNTQVTYTAIQNTDLFCWDYGVESVLSYLPLSHVAGQMMDVFLIMSKVAHLTSLTSFTSCTSLTSFMIFPRFTSFT